VFHAIKVLTPRALSLKELTSSADHAGARAAIAKDRSLIGEDSIADLAAGAKRPWPSRTPLGPPIKQTKRRHH